VYATHQGLAAARTLVSHAGHPNSGQIREGHPSQFWGVGSQETLIAAQLARPRGGL
jgi:hypothetical protein